MTIIAADSTPVVHSAPKIAHSARARVLLEDAIVPTVIRMAWPNVLVMGRVVTDDHGMPPFQLDAACLMASRMRT
jgi:hypothetical protein